mgnify:CR=1 FL=1
MRVYLRGSTHVSSSCVQKEKADLPGRPIDDCNVRDAEAYTVRGVNDRPRDARTKGSQMKMPQFSHFFSYL